MKAQLRNVAASGRALGGDMGGRRLARSVSAAALVLGGLLVIPLTADAAPQPQAAGDQLGLIVRDGIPVAVTITAGGQDARFTFSSVAGQQVSAYLSASTFGAQCGSVLVSLVRPNGTAFGNSIGSCNQTAFLDSQTLDATGSWTILVDPQGTRTGTANLQAFNTNDAVGLTRLDGSAFNVVTENPGENGRYKFTGTTGQKVSALISAAGFTGCPAYAISLTRPDGSPFGANVSSCSDTAFLDTQTLDQTGVWSISVNPQGMTTGTATLRAYDASDVVRPIPLNGAAINVSLVPGQSGRYTFTGTNGQQVSSAISASTLAGCPGFALSLARPDGTTLGSAVNGCGATAFLDAKQLDQDGDWSIVVDPTGAGTGTAEISGYTFEGDNGAILLTGKPAFLDFTKPGQNARWTFTGTAGTPVSVYVNKSTIAPCGLTLSLIRPDGTTLGSPASSCDAAAFLDTRVLDQTGTWTALVDPHGVGLGTAKLRVFQVVDEKLANKPGKDLKTFTALVPGRNARYTFTGRVGDSRTVSITSTYPGCPSLVVSFVRPNGTVLKSTTTCTRLLALTATLDVAGGWTLFIDPQGPAMGTMLIRLT